MSKQYFHICNPTTPEPTSCKNIISKAELEAIINDSNFVYLIYVHLNWEGRKLSSNYGFDIANFIRTKTKSFSPIIFYSPIQQKYFETKSEKEIKYKILFGRGSAFIESPFKEQQLTKLAESLQPLNKASLHDVATMLCDLKGIVIDKLNHDLKFNADVDAVIAKVSPYLSAEQKRLIGLEKFTTEIKKSIKTNQEYEFNDLKSSFILLCNQKLIPKGENISNENRTKYKVLFVDDLQEELVKVKNYLGKEYEIEVATTGASAIQILKDDTKNKIVAVVSDWRLFMDAKQKTYWQPLQGYEVLDFAAKNGIRSLFTITSQADFVVHHIRNLMGIRFSLFKKENLTTADQWKVLSDVLFESCEQAFKLRYSIPTSVNWINNENKGRNATYTSLQQQYIEKWNSDERDTYWTSIDDKCNEIWTWLESERSGKYKDVYTLKVKYNMSLSSDEPELFSVLVFRRIWMALWYSKNDAKIISKEGLSAMKEFCFEVMFTGMSKNYNSSAPGTELNKLCLKVNEICARKMLPEEIEWLMKCELI